MTEVEAAIVDERSHVGVRLNVVRLVGLAAWASLAIGLGVGGRPEWLIPVPALGAWIAIALGLQLASRRDAVRRQLWLVVPLVDVPMVAIVQTWFLAVSNRPDTVAVFAIAIFASLIFVSQLAFSWRSVALTLAGALIGSAIVLWRAHLPVPNLLSAVFLLGWATAVALFSGSRVQRLVATIVRAKRSRETELAELVATRTRELTERNRELLQALDSVARAQAELVRAERMASVAVLVQGIAHELNNPIGYIAGNVPPLQRYAKFLTDAATALADGRARTPAELAALVHLDGKRDLAYVATDLAAVTEDIAEGARRAKLIVGDLQRLTARSGRALEPVDLVRAVEQTRALFAPRLPSGVTLTVTHEPVPELRARAGELEQVLVNLVDNAIRAVGERGRVAIELSHADDAVVLVVRDDGCGMSAADQARATEPFFTTRTAGEGAGLGLAIAASIVESHGATMSIESASGVGTSVTVRCAVAPQ
jgi:two-component system NtrC family sensor kinase